MGKTFSVFANTARGQEPLPARSALRRRLPILLMLIGAGLLAYVSFEYYGMYHEQKRLAQEWSKQNRTHDTKQLASRIVTNALTRVTIPKVGLDALVVDGTSRRQLKIAPGRMLNTAIPGENGNSVITAHRDTFFRHIVQLKQGDEIEVRRNGELLTFRVTGQRIVGPSDTWVAQQTPDPQLTLLTCYPPYYVGPAPKRLAVFSKLVSRRIENDALSAQPLNTNSIQTR